MHPTVEEQKVLSALSDVSLQLDAFVCDDRGLRIGICEMRERFEIRVAPYQDNTQFLFISCQRLNPKEEVKLHSSLFTVVFPPASSGIKYLVAHLEVLLNTLILPQIRQDCTAHLRQREPTLRSRNSFYVVLGKKWSNKKCSTTLARVRAYLAHGYA